MHDQPAIKGMLFATVAADFEALAESGRITREALEARLEARDLEILAQKLAPALWYPVDCYERLLETLAEVEGGTDPERYLRRRGAEAAERMIESGLYSQLEATVDTWGERVGKVMVTLGPVCFNFGQWSADHDESRLYVDVEDAAAIPDVSLTVIAGFIEVMTRRAYRADVAVDAERPSIDRVRWVVRR